MLIDLLLLTAIIVFIIDLSGITTTLRKVIAYIVSKYFIKVQPDDVNLPFVSCSLCTTFWMGIFYITYTGNFTIINLAIVCVLAFLTGNIADIFYICKDMLVFLTSKVYNLIKK